MEQEELTVADLTAYMQSKSKVSEVMNRKRPLSLSMIRALHRGLQIPAEVLVQESQAPYLGRRPKNKKARAST